MSHRTGTLHTLTPAIQIGPDTGDPATVGNTWQHNFTHTPAPTGTKLLILHFQNVDLPPGNRLEVELGYDTDVFTSANGEQFWTRPVNIYALAGGPVPIRYVADGSLDGSAQLDRYGRGERLTGEQDPTSLSNCDPFQEHAVYEEPDYDPFWYCGEPPNWENAACVVLPDIRAHVARSVGMIVTVHESDEIVSTCTVTLVDADKVLTAGHCVNPSEALTSSVTFDYRTTCAGNRPAGYNARFYKVVEVLEQRYSGGHDYALLRLAEAPSGIPAIQVRHNFPAAGDEVFGIHHPNGAVKKLSIPHPGFSTVLGHDEFSIRVPEELDTSGGSSGSGLFDTAGRIVGILAGGNPCGNPPYPTTDLSYYPTASFFLDTAQPPPPQITRGVMIVFDRSGSMSQDDGTGRTKIESARDAASLFVQLTRSAVGNGIGQVSFSGSASSPVDFNLVGVTSANKTALIGPSPFSGGVVGGLSPGGHTSIGDGLDAARAELQGAGFSSPAILLLTDGRQNRAPMIDDVEAGLGDIAVHAIGFGSEANLDGELLTQLAADHDGLYMRAGNGLALEKFFTEAFGNIFESGVLFDPEFSLPVNASGQPISFPVCGETMITAATGWDRTDTSLSVEITSPGGAIITRFTPGVESSTGRTWSFLRVPLPHGGERDGVWQVRVLRPTGSGEFPPPTPALRYFLDVIPSGGPRLLLAEDRLRRRRRYYTGDFIGPLVMLRYDDGGWPPHHASVKLTLSRPDKGTGNILSETGLGSPTVIDGDAVSARQATLQALEAAKGSPLVQYVERSFTLGSGPGDTGGRFESAGVYGTGLSDELSVEGNYTLHAKATYGEQCQGARELTWSISVAVGIDAGNTGVTSTPLGTEPDGSECLRVTLTPRDRYDNHLGPGRLDRFEIQALPGTMIKGGVTDLGNGSYRLDICRHPDADQPPQVGIVQPDRPLVVIPVPGARHFVYSVRFVCGEQADDCCGCAPVRPGRYATAISIHNLHDREVAVSKRFIPTVLSGAVVAREPRLAGVAARDKIVLPANSAMMDDCCRILELLLGAKPGAAVPLTMGVLEIVSLVELSVTAVYTSTDLNNGSTSMHSEDIVAKVRNT